MAGYRGNYQGAGKDTTVEATPVSVPALPEKKPAKPTSQQPSTRRSSNVTDVKRTSGTRTATRSVRGRPGGGGSGNSAALLMLGVVVVLAILAFLLLGDGGVTFERTCK